jgi:hypothetical protein
LKHGLTFDRATKRAIIKARKAAASHGVAYLLTKPGQNIKTEKSAKVCGVAALPLHLAPFNLSGFQVCPMASAGCAAACLHTAGNPAHMAGKERARIARTRFYFRDRASFMALLCGEIKAHVDRAARHDLAPAFRLNATSDIPFERVGVEVGGQSFANIFEAFPDVSFYDYTKRPGRDNLPRNYSLTFSLSEENDARAIGESLRGVNVAVVFNVTRLGRLPTHWRLGDQILPVTDGDLHDYRPVDPRPCIVGLRAKGDARGDDSGFVRQPNVD